MALGQARRHRRFSLGRLALLAIALGLAFTLGYAATSRQKGNPSVKVVEIDLGHGVKVVPAMSKANAPNTESFEDIVDRTKPYAAINGTYYDENMKPLGDVLIDGRLVNRGHYRHAIAVTRDGRVHFIVRGKRRLRWTEYESGLAAGPKLVHNGKIALDPVADGFSRRSLTIRAWRSGVGRTRSGKLLLVTVKQSITLGQFAQIMLDLESQEAMNLDGGGACGLYHNGRYLAIPPLPMSNVLLVYKKTR